MIRIDDLPARPPCPAGCDPEQRDRERPAPDKIVETCRACGRKHYRVLIPILAAERMAARVADVTGAGPA